MCVIQGKGKTISVGAVSQKFVSIDFLSLILGRSLKGSIFGGLKPKSDLPFLVDKCFKKVSIFQGLVCPTTKLTDILFQGLVNMYSLSNLLGLSGKYAKYGF